MDRNMGIMDRTLRVFAVAVIAALYFTHQIAGTLSLVLGIVAALFVATSAVGWCPLYVPLGISSRNDLNAAKRAARRILQTGGHHGSIHT